MTSKSDSQETSEFLRRRQLRLQQVREQSKDIAKKIRQRAKVEKLRQVVVLDERKERDYKQNQEKVVKKLEELYSRGLSNVGSSHKRARGLVQPDNLVEKVDLSHLRGKEAVAEVKRQKQQKLDELKKALDRKLHAREAANELSREKSASAANKLSKLSSKVNIVNEESKSTSENANGDVNLNDKDIPEGVSRADMGTQWDIDLLSPEWEANVPALALPQEDDIKESTDDKGNAIDKQKKSDLFAVSDEMPSSLRGGVVKPCNSGPSKLSSTLVSEYIQNRVLRLREPEVNTSRANEVLRSKESDNALSKKKSVTTYNHSTRDSRDVPCAEERVVHRDRSLEQDAYSQALSESLAASNYAKQRKSQDAVNKIAVKRQNVEKEYNDTIAFLNSLPKNKNNRPINNAFKADHRLQAQRDNRQKILQEEFRNIEEENRRLDTQGYRSKSRLSSRSPSKQSRSPVGSKVDNHWNERDIQYSWMPVPESDSKLAVHTIPAEGRAGRAPHAHAVKFGVDTYHEYRSRHKHTPPTKDTAGATATAAAAAAAPDTNAVRTVIFQDDDDTLSDESLASENSSTDGRQSDPVQNVNVDDSLKRKQLTDTERIIIYKILNYKHRKKNKSVK
ncbi:cingulin isoform X4 [Leguminivora glycinivorella]|uniref:cingulin isoform X4 n=1 Tax=Leguminivora glycinivorella TaxID=1035111 RepID=UPI00200F3F35|nr:cingulin isoform X4 [Leguminivora glycinivorella]